MFLQCSRETAGMKIFFSLLTLLIVVRGASQNVGIGTPSPHPKAILEIKTTNKGILFPRLTSAQRNSIVNPPDGLHIFNTDERCLNYYDADFALWNCYCECDSCKVTAIRIASGCNIDFYNTYGINYPYAKKFLLLVDTGVTLACGTNYTGAINFNTMQNTEPVTIRIVNRGSILGEGG
jgi:hypothetical protein